MRTKWIDFNNKKNVFGLKIPTEPCVDVAEPTLLGDVLFTSEWVHHALPTYNQGSLGSCVGMATANWIECMVRKHIDRNAFKLGEQIDGEKIWRRGREMFWPHEPREQGGLLLDQGFKAAIDLGILPPGTQVERVARRLSSMSISLQTTPLVIGQLVHNKWNSPNHDNGEVYQAKGEPDGGHAILLVGITRQKTVPYLIFQNSWGRTWAWNGCGMLSETHWLQNMLDYSYTVSLPSDWKQHGGWKTAITVKSETK